MNLDLVGLPIRTVKSRARCGVGLAAILLLSLAAAAQTTAPLELTRTIRTWEFLPIVGQQAGLFGDESGRFEGWVYPLKIFRGFHLTFHVADRALPAESLARTLTVRPESASILYVGDSFRVRETLCVPVNQPGAVIQLEVETEQPLEIEAGFIGDFQLEWPAGLGGTYVNWDPKERAVSFGEETRKFAAFVGSPTAEDAHLAYETNYSSSDENTLRLGVTAKGKETKLLVMAASVNGVADAIRNYERLVASSNAMVLASAEYYQAYLDKATVSLELPDSQLQQAYDWARVSTIQGLVNNPYLGTGLVAGYRTSGGEPASGICVVLRQRFTLDFVRAECGRRFHDHSHCAGFHQQISARRRQGSARNLAERKPGAVVQRVSVPLRFCRCDAAVHHRNE